MNPAGLGSAVLFYPTLLGFRQGARPSYRGRVVFLFLVPAAREPPASPAECWTVLVPLAQPCRALSEPCTGGTPVPVPPSGVARFLGPRHACLHTRGYPATGRVDHRHRFHRERSHRHSRHRDAAR